MAPADVDRVGAISSLKVSQFTVLLGDAESSTDVIAYNTRTGFICRIRSSILRAIRGAVAYPEEELLGLTELQSNGFLVDKDTDEAAALIDENKRYREAEGLLYFVVQPSSFCTFGCHYCGQSHSLDSVSSDTSDNIIRWLDQQLLTDNHKRVRIGWFGAEPLSAYSKIIHLGTMASKSCARKSIPISSKIVTNGYSLSRNAVSALIAETGLDEVEVTLDGPRATHDARRSPTTSRKSYEKIVSNLLSISDLPIRRVIRCNVDSDNFHEVDELISDLTARGLGKSCELYFAPLHSWGNNAHLEALDAQVFAIMELRWKVDLLRLGWSVGFLPRRRLTACLATRENSYVFDSSGGVYGCTEFPLVPSYASRRLGLSDQILDPEFPTDSLRSFETAILGGTTYCRTCFNLPTCGGSCPKDWAEGRVPCPPFKYTASEALKCALLSEKFKSVSEAVSNG